MLVVCFISCVFQVAVHYERQASGHQQFPISVLPFQTQNDFMMICNVAKILELVVPLMEQPSENFLNTIEEDLMKLIIKYGMTVSVLSLRKHHPC